MTADATVPRGLAADAVIPNDLRRYPRLLPGWVFARHAEGALLLNTLRRTRPLVLKGDPAGLVTVLGLCTGETALGQIRHEAAWTAKRVVALIEDLRDRRVVMLHSEPVSDPYAALPRYARQLEFMEDKLGSPDAAIAAQRQLLGAHVTVIGLGGVAHWLLTALAAVGLRHIRLVDPDVVEVSNLSRQFMFGLDFVGQPKVLAAADHLRRCDVDFVLEPEQAGVWSLTDAERVLRGTDLAVVTVGHVPSRITDVTNRAAVAAGLPLLLAGGATWGPLVVPGRTACIGCFGRALRDSSPLTFATLAQGSPRFPTGTHTPVLATAIAPAAIAAADDVISYLTGQGEPRSLGAVVRPSDPASLLTLTRLDDCDVCGGHVE